MIRAIFHSEKGQGLAEYALILTLVAVVVIVILAILGPAVGNVFSNIVASLEQTSSGSDVVVITRADYDSGHERLHIDATSNGDYNPSVTLTASPGGVMEARAHHYHLDYALSGCPCTVTVTSSLGGSASVTVH